MAVSVLAQRFSSMRVTIWLIVLIPLGAVGGACYHAQSQSCQSTDDAFIDGHIINVAPLVAGRVDRVLVEDNQVVKKGDLVVVLDNRNFVATSNQKVAALDNVRAPEVAVKASIEQAIAHVAEARATVNTFLALQKGAQAQIEEGTANLQAAKLNESYREIRAPEHGRVTQKAIEPGDYARTG